MIVKDLPFNVHIGIEASGREDALLSLADAPRLRNHIGTMHAGALFTLAEAASGDFLLRSFPAELTSAVLPVLRRAEVKYSAPARGRIGARAVAEEGALGKVAHELAARGRSMVKVSVVLEDESGAKVFQGGFEWFVQMVTVP